MRWSTGSILRGKLGHKLFAYLTIFLAQVTLLLGGIAYYNLNGSQTILIVSIVLFGAFFLITGLIEFLFRRFRKQETSFALP